MNAKSKRRKRTPSGDGIEVIDLRDPQAMLLANDQMNERYGDGHVAYLDERRGMKVYRRIIAHGNDLLAINEAIDALSKAEQCAVMLHYAMKPTDENIVYDWTQTFTE